MSDASPQALEGSVVGGGQVPKAIDDFIDELLGMSGMPEPMGQRDGSAGGAVGCPPAAGESQLHAGRSKPTAGESK